MNDDQNVESVNYGYDHSKPEANGDGSLDDVLCLADYLRHGSDDESQRVDTRDNPITDGLLKMLMSASLQTKKNYFSTY